MKKNNKTKLLSSLREYYNYLLKTKQEDKAFFIKKIIQEMGGEIGE